MEVTWGGQSDVCGSSRRLTLEMVVHGPPTCDGPFPQLLASGVLQVSADGFGPQRGLCFRVSSAGIKHLRLPQIVHEAY